MEREVTILGNVHPEFLENGTLLRVDHPTVDPLTSGAPTLGWDGDSRLAIYLHLQSQRFILYRLESDGEYRGIARLPIGAEITPASINSLITRLIEIDSRRGFDPGADVEKAQAKAEKARLANLSAQIAEVGDKLHFGLARQYLPGIDVFRPRQVPIHHGPK